MIYCIIVVMKKLIFVLLIYNTIPLSYCQEHDLPFANKEESNNTDWEDSRTNFFLV